MVGQTISHYHIDSKLGEGGMGVVYKGEDSRLGRTVALKFLAPHLTSDEQTRKRFIREARAAASLDHPNIATVFDIDEAEGTVFLAMALVEGRTVKDQRHGESDWSGEGDGLRAGPADGASPFDTDRLDRRRDADGYACLYVSGTVTGASH
jgi:serine/threonine protein kinase